MNTQLMSPNNKSRPQNMINVNKFEE